MITSIKNEQVFIQKEGQDTSLQLTLAEIKKIRVQENLIAISKNFETELPPTLKLFFTNTAFSMKNGERNYRTYWGNSISYTFQVSDEASVGIGLSFPFFIHGNLKVADKAKNKNRRHGGQIGVAWTPIGIGDEGAGAVIEISQMNTWGTPDKFFNLTFNYFENAAVSYTHLTLPTICSV